MWRWELDGIWVGRGWKNDVSSEGEELEVELECGKISSFVSEKID